eukprot:135316-Pelagomonas_calceolata.AAC.3
MERRGAATAEQPRFDQLGQPIATSGAAGTERVGLPFNPGVFQHVMHDCCASPARLELCMWCRRVKCVTAACVTHMLTRAVHASAQTCHNG